MEQLFPWKLPNSTGLLASWWLLFFCLELVSVVQPSLVVIVPYYLRIGMDQVTHLFASLFRYNYCHSCLFLSIIWKRPWSSRFNNSQSRDHQVCQMSCEFMALFCKKVNFTSHLAILNALYLMNASSDSRSVMTSGQLSNYTFRTNWSWSHRINNNHQSRDNQTWPNVFNIALLFVCLFGKKSGIMSSIWHLPHDGNWILVYIIEMPLCFP